MVSTWVDKFAPMVRGLVNKEDAYLAWYNEDGSWERQMLLGLGEGTNLDLLCSPLGEAGEGCRHWSGREYSCR